MSEAAGKVKIILTADAATYSAALKSAQAQLNQFARSSKAAAHGTVAPWQASSAALRVLEGNMTNNIRAAERFIATIPGLRTALVAAFPAVGAIALLGVFTRMSEEVVKFIENARKMPDAISRGFREVNASSILANDELRKTNDELGNQIAKLEGRHQNQLAVEIDEARIAADKLAASLEKDNQQTAQLLEKNHVGPLQSLVSGQYATRGTEGSVNYWDQRLSDQAYAYRNAVRATDANSDQARQAKATLDAIRAAALQWVNSRLAQVNTWADVGGRAANVNILQGYRDTLTQQQDSEDLNAQNESRTLKSSRLEEAKAAAAKFAEAQKKQQDQIIRAMQDELVQEKATRDMTLADEANFWIARAAMLHDGSQAYQEALAEANKAIAGQHAEHGRLMDEWNKSAAEPVAADDLSRDPEVTRGIQEQSRAVVEWLKNLNEAPLIQQQNAQALAEQSLQMAVTTGQMSRLDAATLRAQMHTQEYSAEIGRLQAAMDQVKAAGYLTPMEKNAQLSGLQNQMATLAGQRDLQVQQDQAAIDSATALDQVREACGQLARRFMDFGGQLANLTTETIQGFNQSLASALMAKASSGHDYRRGITNAVGGQFRELGSRGLNMAMENVEGPLLSKFGLKGLQKPDGSQSNPLYVKMVGDGAGGIGTGGLSSILKQQSGDTSGLQTEMPELTSLIPGFAGGGDTPSNMPFLVGEDGPEIMSMPHSAHVTPNSRTAIGGNLHMPISVDARGSNDPAETEAAVYRGLNAALPHFTTAAMSAMADDRRRSPLSKAR